MGRVVAGGEALGRWLGEVGAEEAFGALAGACRDAVVFAVDRDRSVVYWSRGAERLLGFEAGEVLGQHCLKSNRCERCMVGCGIALHGRVEDVPMVLFRADGASVRLRKTGRAFFDEQGAFAGGIEVLVPDEGAPRLPREVQEGVVVFHGLVSADPAMHRVFETCRNVAETQASVLIRGESGTGKELLARAVHAESDRREGPFVAINCAALTPSLAESELFGHVKGAFTGAVRDRRGIFEQASGGTLFLDEVAELPLELQAKLLRVLEEHRVTPVGASSSMAVDVRLVSATHRSLREMAAQGRFREDLMFRLRVVPIFLPALRERKPDIPVLAWRFIGARNKSGPRVVEAVAPEAMRALLDHDWRGNVRELRNVIDYAFAVGRGPEIRVEGLPPELRAASAGPAAAERAPVQRGAACQGPRGVGVEEVVEAPEAVRIREAIARAGGHLGVAASLLGISRPTLWRRRKRHGI